VRFFYKTRERANSNSILGKEIEHTRVIAPIPEPIVIVIELSAPSTEIRRRGRRGIAPEVPAALARARRPAAVPKNPTDRAVSQRAPHPPRRALRDHPAQTTDDGSPASIVVVRALRRRRASRPVRRRHRRVERRVRRRFRRPEFRRLRAKSAKTSVIRFFVRCRAPNLVRFHVPMIRLARALVEHFFPYVLDGRHRRRRRASRRERARRRRHRRRRRRRR